MSTSVREMIREAQRELRGDLSPARACELQNTLTALLGNTNEELRESDLDYRHILLQAYKTHDTANRAKIAAETSPEYARFRQAKDTKDLCMEMIRSIRQYLRTAAEEMRLSR